jgi:hypothetical protein
LYDKQSKAAALPLKLTNKDCGNMPSGDVRSAGRHPKQEFIGSVSVKYQTALPQCSQ